MEVWKYYTIKGAIVIIEKAVKAIKSKTINDCWRKLRADIDDFTGFTTEPVKETMKKTVDVAKTWRMMDFRIQILEEFKS